MDGNPAKSVQHLVSTADRGLIFWQEKETGKVAVYLNRKH